MMTYTISKEDYEKEVIWIKSSIHTLKNIKAEIKGQNNNPEFPWQFKGSSIQTKIDELSLRLRTKEKQFNCKHTNTTGLRYVGHDSHKDHYENLCLDCGFVIERDYV